MRKWALCVVAAAIGIAGSDVSAQATVFTIDAIADPTTGVHSNFSFGGTDYQIYTLNLGLGLPDVPFSLNSGDTVVLNLGLTSLLTVPSGGNQYFGVNLEPRDGGLSAADSASIAVSGTIAFVGTGPSGPSGFSGLFSNVIYSSGPAYGFTGLTSQATFTFNGGPVTVTDLSISYQVDSPSPVPGPIAGAGIPGLVMALGAFLAWRRREAKTLAA